MLRGSHIFVAPRRFQDPSQNDKFRRVKELVEKQGVNFSQITQAAIKEYLGVDRP